MFKNKNKSLVLSLIVGIGGTIILFNILQARFITKNAEKNIISDSTADYTEILEGNARAVENKLESYFKALDFYVNAEVMITEDFGMIYEWLHDQNNLRDPDFDYIMIAGPDGYYQADTGASANVSDRQYFKDIMVSGKERTVDNPVISKSTGQPIVHVTRAIKVNGRTIAMVAGVLNLQTLTKEINKIKIGTDGYAWMLASDGTVLAHPVAEYVMEMNLITGISDTKNHGDLVAVAQKIADGQAGNQFVNSTSRKGKDLCLFTPISGTPWGFAISIPESQIYDLANKIQMLMIAFGLGSLILTLGISSFLLIISIKPLIFVKNAIEGIASGNADLTKRLETKSNNEVGAVVNGFNRFIEKLQTIITDVKASKEDLGLAGEDMASSSQDTASAITEILANIDSMHRQIMSQSTSVDETAGAVNEIASNIESLEHMIETQSSGVTQASAAVEQMIGNIKSVNNSVEKMAMSFSDLEKNISTGIARQQAVNERIQQIEQQSAMLQEANSTISAIAEQTNLLAMNAAIEAAHAGEAGKGFSVVADEIRKLSETSTAQSKTIGEQLTNIKDSINEVVLTSGDSNTAFESVSHQIKDTDQLVVQIKAAMQEQEEGSHQITDALHMMNDSTSEVRNAAMEMSEGNKAILEEVRRLQEFTSAMKGSMEEMSVGARTINETGVALNDIAEKMQGAIVKIGNQIDQFKVD